MMNPVTACRKQLGISRAELARRSRSAYMTIITIENGLPQTISVLTANRLSPVLGKPAEQLMQDYAAYRDSLAAMPEAA